MSYEGFVQYLTDKGHYFTLDAYDEEADTYLQKELPGEVIVWKNHVDQTNGSQDEHGNNIDGFIELERVGPQRTAVCKHCGRYDMIFVYKLPPPDQGHHIPSP